MRILLLGAGGQLGRELGRTLPDLGNVKVCGRADVDLTDKHSIIEAIDAFDPDVITNAAAYTAVDKAESERDLAFKINAEAVGILANEAVKRDVRFIHYSTDYVFDGSKKGSYVETDPPNPVNVYGASKLAGEKAIIASGCKHLIFRATWVIGRDGSNFAKTVLRLATERDTLGIVNDQFGVPTAPALIAKVTVAGIAAMATSNPWPSGIYHLAPHGETTWHGIARTLLQLAREARVPLATDGSALHAITTAEYPTPAKRPLNSLLDTGKLEQQLDFKLPHWKIDFFKVANEIIEEFKSA
uniref:dTDP-4-dehydrorhamnose reductase n=1 Tax=Candidatus Kentrum sp. SD TaxID=2126332 RepID=A0A451BLV6_9GAMM|nr:MAG: dTDP-4-dehydrorhamnose reductase [Candidatus Kentron sp. SD]